jgi:hypothetical protein
MNAYALLGLFFIGGGGFVVAILLMVIATKYVGRRLKVVSLFLLTLPFLYGQHRFNPRSGGPHDAGISTAEILLLLLTGIIVIWACGLIVAPRKRYRRNRTTRTPARAKRNERTGE